MRYCAALFILSALFQVFHLSAEEGFCRKCDIMRDYHKKNPSKYKYYEDYQKDLQEKGEDAVNPNPEDVPDEVRNIMNANKKASE